MNSHDFTNIGVAGKLYRAGGRLTGVASKFINTYLPDLQPANPATLQSSHCQCCKDFSLCSNTPTKCNY